MHESDPFRVAAERLGLLSPENHQAFDIPAFCIHSIKSDRENTNIT